MYIDPYAIFITAEIECSFEIIIEATEIMLLSIKKSHYVMLKSCKRAFDLSLTVANERPFYYGGRG